MADVEAKFFEQKFSFTNAGITLVKYSLKQIYQYDQATCMRDYYNMIVWHFGPCVTFWPCLCDISARLVWHFGPLVRNEGKRVSP